MKLSKTALENINNSDYQTVLSILIIHIGENEANEIITDYVEFVSHEAWAESLDKNVVEILEIAFA